MPRDAPRRHFGPARRLIVLMAVLMVIGLVVLFAWAAGAGAASPAGESVRAWFGA
jgi:hypothetical protein